jgi:hypothetical protein
MKGSTEPYDWVAEEYLFAGWTFVWLVVGSGMQVLCWFYFLLILCIYA